MGAEANLKVVCFCIKKYYINIFLCKNYVQIFGYGKERDSANADSVTMMYRAISV